MEDLVEQQQKLDVILKQDTTESIIEVKTKPSLFSKFKSWLTSHLTDKNKPIGLSGFMGQGFKIL